MDEVIGLPVLQNESFIKLRVYLEALDQLRDMIAQWRAEGKDIAIIEKNENNCRLLKEYRVDYTVVSIFVQLSSGSNREIMFKDIVEIKAIEEGVYCE